MGFQLVNHRLVTPFTPQIQHGQDLIGQDGILVGFQNDGKTEGSLVVHSGTHDSSDFGSGGTSGSPMVIEGIQIGKLVQNNDWVTLKGSEVLSLVNNDGTGTGYNGLFLDSVTFTPATVGDLCATSGNYGARRTLFKGNSDGVRCNTMTSNPMVFTECIFRTELESNADHNDCVQGVNPQGLGKTARPDGDVQFIRSLFYQDPDPGAFTAKPGSSVCQFADFVGTSGTLYVVFDSCYFFGSTLVASPTDSQTLRLYDGGTSANIRYKVTNCIWDVTSKCTPYGLGSSNTTPTSQVEWSNNRYSDGTPITLG